MGRSLAATGNRSLECFLLLFLSASIAKAAIAYSYIEYRAFAEVDTTYGGDSQEDYKYSPTDHVVSAVDWYDAGLGEDDSPYYSYAAAWSPPNADLYAASRTRNNTSGSDDYVASLGDMYLTLTFEATAPSLHLVFDYYWDVDASGVSGDSQVEYRSVLDLQLDDQTTNSPVFTWQEGLQSVGDYDEIDSGVFDEVLALTVGHDYKLRMRATTEIFLENEAYADANAYFANIEMNLVPIPGAVWLLGSGLVGLFGIRRKFKT